MWEGGVDRSPPRSLSGLEEEVEANGRKESQEGNQEEEVSRLFGPEPEPTGRARARESDRPTSAGG